MKKSILIFLLAVIPASTYASIEEPIQLQAGQISGTLLDNGVQAFLGCPLLLRQLETFAGDPLSL